MTMNLAENLKKIRKENNISQEQLAEQLGVSRQSVSKWESGTAYPEMDKLLQIAKLFNVNIDDLLNQDIKEVNNEKQSKLAINKSIDDFLAFISKTIDMFSSMKFKDKCKCIIEQAIIIGVLTLVFLIFGAIGSSILYNILSFLPWEVVHIIDSIFESIYLVCVLVLGFILLVHVFKTRYLDYYVVVKEKESEIAEEDKTKVEPKEEKLKKIYLEKKKEKIVIRDPKHSEYRFISGLLKCLLFFIKCITLFVALAFCATLIAFALTLVISFMVAKTGLFFIGLLLVLISCIVINLIILLILFNFIMSKKSKKKLLLISFLVALLLCGIGTGLIAIGVTEFNYINDISNEVFIENEVIIPMEKDLIIDDNIYCYGSCTGINYVEENRSDIKIAYKHTKYFELYQYKHNNYLYLDVINSYDNFFGFSREIIKDINNKNIINYSNFEIIIYTSKENIELLKQNQIEYYNNQIEEDNYTNKLEEENIEYQNKISALEETIEYLQSEIEMYKKEINAEVSVVE